MTPVFFDPLARPLKGGTTVRRNVAALTITVFVLGSCSVPGPWPSQYKKEFMDSCKKGDFSAACGCILGRLQKDFPDSNDFVAYEQKRDDSISEYAPP